jgi:hypothetical protein
MGWHAIHRVSLDRPFAPVFCGASLFDVMVCVTHRKDAEIAENSFSWSDYLRGIIRPNNLPSAKQLLITINIVIVLRRSSFYKGKSLSIGQSFF